MKIAKDYINLLPPEARAKRTVNVWSLLLTLFVAAWIAVFSVKLLQRWNLQAGLVALELQKQPLQQQLTALQKELGITGGMNAGKTSLIRSLLGERVLRSEVFKQFSRIVPRGMWFDSLEGNAGEAAQVRIRGGAFTYAIVKDFMDGMQKTGYFEQPDLRYAQKSVLRGHDIISFEIVCGIKKKQGGR